MWFAWKSRFGYLPSGWGPRLVERLAPVIPSHQSLKVFFSPANPADHDQCITAINSYFHGPTHHVGVTLLLNPFDDMPDDSGKSQD